MLLIALLAVAAIQLPPPNLLENGDARAGDAHWDASPGRKPVNGQRSKNALIESCDGNPCFVLRNGASWNQRVRFLEDPTGKFLLIVARGSSERTEDRSITGRPYLWARLIGVEPYMRGILQGMQSQARVPNRWGTMSGIFQVPPGAQSIHLMIGQAEGRGTPQNGSAARVTDVEVRLFDTREAAAAYLKVYEAQHASH